MSESTLRFVCSGDGQHKERTLATVVYHHDDDQTYPVAERGTGGFVIPPHPDTPIDDVSRGHKRSQNEAHFGAHLRNDLGLSDSEARKSQFRVRLECPHCRPLPVLSGKQVDAMARRVAQAGSACTVDVSTGAIIHKQ